MRQVMPVLSLQLEKDRLVKSFVALVNASG